MQRALCVCVRDEKSWNIEPKDTKNIYFLIRKVLKHWTKSNKKSIFNLFLSLMWHLRIFQFSLCIKCAIWQNLMFSHMRSLLLYININIYILMKKGIQIFLKSLMKDRNVNYISLCMQQVIFWIQSISITILR